MALAMTVKELKDYLETLPDTLKVYYQCLNNYTAQVKHVSHATYRDGSPDEILLFVGMGTHFPETLKAVSSSVWKENGYKP